MANRWGKNGNSGRFYFPGLRNDYSHEIKGQLLLERKATTNLVFTLGHFSHVQLFATPWTVARQAPLSMGFSTRLEYWSGLPRPPPGDIRDPGTETISYIGKWVLYHKHHPESPDIKKQRHHLADKDPYGQSYVSSSSHVHTWDSDHTEGCAEELMLLNCGAGEDS